MLFEQNIFFTRFNAGEVLLVSHTSSVTPIVTSAEVIMRVHVVNTYFAPSSVNLDTFIIGIFFCSPKTFSIICKSLKTDIIVEENFHYFLKIFFIFFYVDMTKIISGRIQF